MIVKTRTTAQGTEYWDNAEKKVLFVPAGEQPSFKVTENPKSMLGNDVEVVVIDEGYDFESMTVKQLKEHAATNNIEIPEGAKKDDIIKLLSDQK